MRNYNNLSILLFKELPLIGIFNSDVQNTPNFTNF